MAQVLVQLAALPLVAPDIGTDGRPAEQRLPLLLAAAFELVGRPLLGQAFGYGGREDQCRFQGVGFFALGRPFVGRLRLVGVTGGADTDQLARDERAVMTDFTGNLGGFEMAQAPDLAPLAKVRCGMMQQFAADTFVAFYFRI